MKENILSDKSYRFALRIIKLYQHLAKQHEPAKLAESLLADRVELQNSSPARSKQRSEVPNSSRFYLPLTIYRYRLINICEL
jgi:hypothetical protein